jgi:hypothetical protein
MDPIVEPLSDLRPQPLDWLWPGRLALGKLSILDGDPEIGKSWITLDLCARLTTGRAFPDGSGGLGPSNVLILNNEDGAEDTVVPRLTALGADLARAFIFRKTFLQEAGALAQTRRWKRFSHEKHEKAQKGEGRESARRAFLEFPSLSVLRGRGLG